MSVRKGIIRTLRGIVLRVSSRNTSTIEQRCASTVLRITSMISRDFNVLYVLYKSHGSTVDYVQYAKTVCISIHQ